MTPSGDSAPPPIAWIELPDQSTVTLDGDCHIGRIEGNEIVNPDSRISRRHAVIQRQGQRFTLVDLGSTNGTFLNDTRIFTARKLRHGDVILVGSLRYIFHQPSMAEVSGVADSAQHTIVAVGKSTCWMLLVAAPETTDPAAKAWMGQVRLLLAGSGARLKRLSGASFLAHWRDSMIGPDGVGAAILETARLSAPAAARLTLHIGAVRVGPAAAPGEENLLGAEVTFTHRLAATAATLRENFILSEPAALALGPVTFLSPLGPKAVTDSPGTHNLFTIAAG